MLLIVSSVVSKDASLPKRTIFSVNSGMMDVFAEVIVCRVKRMVYGSMNVWHNRAEDAANDFPEARPEKSRI